MEIVAGKLTVYFEEPYWVGVFERVEQGRLSAAKVVFGAQPRECDVYAFVLAEYHKLEFSPAVAASMETLPKNPKSARRKIRKHGVGTRSQQALKLMHEQVKAERGAAAREKKQDKQQNKFEIRQKRRKEKHKGR